MEPDYPLDSVNLLAESHEGKYQWTLRQDWWTPPIQAPSAAQGVPLLINHFNYYLQQGKIRGNGYARETNSFDFQSLFMIIITLLPVFRPRH
jgi:hypothetical protein